MSCKSEQSAICWTAGELKAFLKDVPDDTQIRNDFEDEAYEFAIWIPCEGEPSDDPFLGIEQVIPLEDEEE